jgi:hypothetical protein
MPYGSTFEYQHNGISTSIQLEEDTFLISVHDKQYSRQPLFINEVEGAEQSIISGKTASCCWL